MSIVNWAPRLPQKLFLIDGLGALLSAFVLGVVLVQWKSVFGIPQHVLLTLAVFPLFFALYDFLCFRLPNKKMAPFLKAIAIVNTLYCLLSLSLAIFHLSSITVYGWAYLIIEIAIVFVLARVEWKTAKRLRSFNASID